MNKSKTVVLGITGGIAAYKAVEVASRLVKLDIEVDTIMTDHATEFVTPLTFRAITHRPVYINMFQAPDQWDIQHINLSSKADILVIVPATANIIGKLAAGIADDLLTTTVMASTSPVLIVPAMNYNMYSNEIVQDNIKKLKKHGYFFMEPDSGRMAEGTSGKGRLPEPEKIVEEINRLLKEDVRSKTGAFLNDFKGLKVMVTAGPTREPIDPVRYITNRSSGKMGYAIAEAATLRGADVVLISGPVNISPPKDVDVHSILTAEEMRTEVLNRYIDCDIIIMVAAVADYKSADVSDIKIKKGKEKMDLKLEKNPDILKELGGLKGSKLLIGSCAETNDLVDNAKKKIQQKNLDMIIANDVTMEGAGFEVDTNIIKLIRRDGVVRDLPLMSKTDAATKILDEIVLLMNMM